MERRNRITEEQYRAAQDEVTGRFQTRTRKRVAFSVGQIESGRKKKEKESEFEIDFSFLVSFGETGMILAAFVLQNFLDEKFKGEDIELEITDNNTIKVKFVD